MKRGACALQKCSYNDSRLAFQSLRAGGPICKSAAMNFLRAHFHEPIHLEDIARAAGVSARVLQSAFKEHVRGTVSDELARLRLSHAARLLCETDLKLGSVAQEAGLRNAKYLCEVFRPAFDATPAAYREARRSTGKIPVSLPTI
jgi:transcriptional regulator GlxA family with amidase domain